MAKQKAQAIKFQHVDKRTVKGRVGHTRTGACPSRGRCQCPKRAKFGR